MMHATFLRITAGLAIASSALAQAPESSLTKSAFAYGIEVTPKTDRAVHSLLIPASVYRRVTRADLGDLRVFNAAGEAVPHARRTLSHPISEVFDAVQVPLFAIAADATQASLPGDLSLQIKRSADGSILEVNSVGSGPNANTALTVAYLLDVGSLEQPVTSITFDLPAEQESIFASYTIESSFDLTTWTTLAPQATLARLERQGSRLINNRVDFRPVRHPYLRLRWLSEPPGFDLVTAHVRVSPEQGVPERHTVQLEGLERNDEPHIFNFPRSGPLPVNQIQLRLPSSNTMVEGTVQFASQAGGPWKRAAQALFYRVTQGSEIVNAPLSVSELRGTHWRLEVSPQGGGLGTGVPTLELGYYPEQLAFLARGEGPFTLAFGHLKAQSTAFDWADFTELGAGDKKASLPRESVTVGAVVEFAGPAALTTPPQPEGTLKKVLLWGVLLAGVCLLGLFAFRLLGETRAGESSTEAGGR